MEVPGIVAFEEELVLPNVPFQRDMELLLSAKTATATASLTPPPAGLLCTVISQLGAYFRRDPERQISL